MPKDRAAGGARRNRAVDKDVPVSAVLNNCKPSLLSRYYGQYYYGGKYGSGYGRGYSKRPRRRPAGRREGRMNSQLLRAFIATALIAASAPGLSQTVPHQSAQRAAIGAGLGQEAMPKGAYFEPRVEGAVQYADNINLAEDSQDQINTFGLELAPGFYGTYSSGNVVAAIDYSLIGRVWEDSDYNDVSQHLAANGEWNAIPEWFTLAAQALYSDAIIDSSQGLNYGGLGMFGAGNLVEVATASVTPRFRHRFSDVVIDTRYSYGRTWYLDEGKGQQPTFGFTENQDSTDQEFNASIALADDASARLNADLSYDWQKSDFDTAIPYEYERAGIDLGYKIARTLTLVGSFGSESDLDASTDEGGLDSEFWDVGIRWQPSERSSFEGRYGDRFFGESWSVTASHRARMLEFEATYSEEPTVETRQLSLGQFDPGTLPPGWPDIDVGRFNSCPI